MADTRHSAFGTETTFHSTDLNALANVTLSGLSSAYDNSSDKHLFMTFKLNLAATAARTAGATVSLWVLPAIDGTNYDDAIIEAFPDAVFPLDAATTARQRTVRDVPIPPSLFKTVVRANMGQAFAASGSTVKGRAHSVVTA